MNITMAKLMTRANVLQSGKLVLSQHPTFRIINDIADAFGVPRAAIRTGIYYKGAVDISSHVTLWWPKILPLRPNTGGWTNKATYNKFSEIVAIEEKNKNSAMNQNHLNDVLQQNRRRVVFGNFRPRGGYEYLGVFELDRNASKSVCVWKRVFNDWNIV